MLLLERFSSVEVDKVILGLTCSLPYGILIVDNFGGKVVRLKQDGRPSPQFVCPYYIVVISFTETKSTKLRSKVAFSNMIS